ncbi:tRNA preQ1(34) S-adenosylmethionine ribosyltransferase-isomerase QueA [Chloroflexota bacterium]
MKTSDFDYDLPSEFIAQTPVEPRDSSRLLVLNHETGIVEHHTFQGLGAFLHPGDLLVLNETRVIPARLYGRKIPTGGRVEFLLLRKKDPLIWETLVGGKGLKPGKLVQIQDGPKGEVVSDLGGPRRLIRFGESLEPLLDQIGHVPLPPYIHMPLEARERYQTVYAQEPGSAAAPTAGLHFTKRLIKQLKDSGANFASVILHVGLDTFAPVNEDDPKEHEIHTEWCQLTPEVADLIRQTKQSGGRVIAVGTTSVRTLETAGREAGRGQIIAAFEGPTDLFILPGFQFGVVDAVITNFHLPRSTLVMLVSAFAGRKKILGAYEIAKQKGYRFYSFGDAMLIL